MRHSCGGCGAMYGCNGGVGSPCTCGHSELVREARRCLPCRERAVLRMQQDADLIPEGAPPMYRFVHNLLDPFAPQEAPPLPPVENARIAWENIPKGERCRCNKCSREAQARGINV